MIQTLIWPREPRGRALAILAVAAATLAGAWTFQLLGFQPCELCYAQRIAYYASLPIAALTAFAALGAPRLAALGFAVLALAFAANAVLAGYHVGVEYHWWAGPSACSGGPAGATDVNDLLNQLDSFKVVRCDEVQLRIFGLSLAGWNVLISAAVALYAALSAVAAAGRGR